MRLLSALGTLGFFIAIAVPAAASDAVTASIAVTVQVSSRTSLRVSSELLEFADAGGTTPTAAVDFRAGARVAAGSDVVLTVEPLRAIDGPGGAADVDAAVSFSGEGDGTLTGSLAPTQPAVAGRWHGSGLRQGRLVFTLHASAAGVYSLPVRFVLSTP